MSTSRSTNAVASVVILISIGLLAVGCGGIKFENLATYAVEGDKVADGAMEPAHQEVWDRFNLIFPAETHPEITTFRAIDAKASGGIDGWIRATNDDRTEWELTLDATNAYGPDVAARTMLHEFMHLLTLRSDQVPLNGSDSCSTYEPPEGCPADGSYLNLYFTEFWSGYTTADYENETAAEGGECENECAVRFGTGEFVTDYAATIPTEDIAESFAEWILTDTPTANSSVAEQKLAFFNDFPELVTLRDDARAALGK